MLSDVVAALTVGVCLEFDSVFAGAVFGGADSLDFGSVSTPLVCAPPLLLTVTPEPTSVLDDVVPEVFGVPVGVVAVSVDVGPLVAVEAPAVVVPGDGVAVDPVDSPVEVVDAELVDDSEDVPFVSAAATPYPVATAATSHAVTAMPPYPPSRAALWAALAAGAGAANRGLTGRLSVMGSTPMA
ncbi:hypothetical protein GGC64_005188 [Mycobacterium sp. OAS707]|uniref:hypothetical protein n=1 Tax=Mycobacterium sp. OAS707 TaxID=2663822 RepID=UPI00178A6CA7|nr:hypothetical protein [Mycobacterium sp. OAS707]MBE1551128.1 hypothetical protein [Mycobacterium sp. OAS707]